MNLVHNAIEAIDGANCHGARWSFGPAAIRTTVSRCPCRIPTGLPEEKARPFSRRSSPPSRAHGHGLCISRSIIETHGDQLHAMPNLTVALSSASRCPLQKEEHCNEWRSNIFVVDDDQTLRGSLRWLLESLRHNVQTFASARESCRL